MRHLVLIVLLSMLSAPAGAQSGVSTAAGERGAGFEDYRTPVGELVGGTLRATLDVIPAAWRPWGEAGPAVRAHLFVPEGAQAKVPGPMLRVTAGTPVEVTLRNRLADTLLVRGLRDRGQDPLPGMPPGPAMAALPFAGDSVVLAPGVTADVRFTPTVPGSYYYFGKTFEPGWSAEPQPVFGAEGPDHTLVGVLIVDAPGEVPHPDERVFLMTHYHDRELPGTWLPTARFMINGRSWPHTERVVHEQGDTVRWRVINQSGAFHPMHLHGFYFHVDAAGGQSGEAPFDLDERPFVVTQTLAPTASTRISWVAHEPGNWIFHCHLMPHMAWMQNAPLETAPRSHAEHSLQGADLMGGLVLGITVRPQAGYTPADDVPRRKLRLHIGMRDGVFGTDPGYAFVLQEGPDPPAPDSIRFPGSPIVLTRGEPTEILVRNRSDVAVGVHWHGLELESWADGVPGWSGTPARVVPAIGPGDSLAVRMTPPRAGTFMYHVHSEPGHQLALGLYGPFLVLEPGDTWDPETDRYFMLGALGSGDDSPTALNGELEPGPMEFRVGTTYRLRFMNVRPDGAVDITLAGADAPIEWRHVARDGADLPPTQVRTVVADVPAGVGMTNDYLWTPDQPGDLTLRIVTNFNPGMPVFPRAVTPRQTVEVPVRVR